MRLPGFGVQHTPLLVAAVASNALVAVALVRVAPTAAILIALVPLLVILAPALTTQTSRAILFSAALALGLYVPWLNRSFALGGANIHTQDIIVLIALAGWLLSKLLDTSALPVPRTPILGWAFLFLATTLAIATLRGHYLYGASFIGQPLRLVLYAGIGVTLVGMTSVGLLRLLTGVLYTGLVVTMVDALYHIATGTSQSASIGLSTGGFRPLAISTSIYCASALFLALLRLRDAQTASAKALHATMAVLGLTGVVFGFGRAVFAAVFVVGIGLLVLSAPLRGSIAAMLPLAAPLLALAGIFIVLAAPQLITSFVERVSAPPTQDANVQWRVQANEAIFRQVREQPLYGVGFGRMSEFYIDIENSDGFLVPFRQELGQDPHNGYLFLLAGGGIVTLASFLLLLGTYVVDVWRRYVRDRDHTDRTLLLWSAFSSFVVLFNAASGTTFESTEDILNLLGLVARSGRRRGRESGRVAFRRACTPRSTHSPRLTQGADSRRCSPERGA